MNSKLTDSTLKNKKKSIKYSTVIENKKKLVTFSCDWWEEVHKVHENLINKNKASTAFWERGEKVSIGQLSFLFTDSYSLTQEKKKFNQNLKGFKKLLKKYNLFNNQKSFCLSS